MNRLMQFSAISLTALSVLTTACGGKKDAAGPDPIPNDTTTPGPVIPPAGVVVALTGNIASCNGNDAATARIVDTLGANAQVIVLGDNERRQGVPQDYNNCYAASWGRFLARTHAASGNHEWDTTTGTATAHFAYFGAAAGAAGQGWQAYDAGAWRVIILNINDASRKIPAINYGPGSDQMNFLSAELAANAGRKCTMVIMHNGYYLSSNTATPTPFTTRGNVQAVYSRLYSAGVDLIVSANEHRYERFAPMDPNGTVDQTRGIRSFNVGTGGESVGAASVFHAGSEKVINAFGVLRLKLTTDGYDFAFINSQNPADTDAGTGVCHQ